MIKRYFSPILAALFSASLLFVSGAASASSFKAVEQTPYNIHIFPNSGIFVFYAQVTEGDMPSCNGDHRWSIALDQPGADVLISMVIAARTAGTTITVVGDGACAPGAFGYNVNYLYYDQ